MERTEARMLGNTNIHVRSPLSGVFVSLKSCTTTFLEKEDPSKRLRGGHEGRRNARESAVPKGNGKGFKEFHSSNYQALFFTIKAIYSFFCDE